MTFREKSSAGRVTRWLGKKRGANGRAIVRVAIANKSESHFRRLHPARMDIGTEKIKSQGVI